MCRLWLRFVCDLLSPGLVVTYVKEPKPLDFPVSATIILWLFADQLFTAYSHFFTQGNKAVNEYYF